MTTFQRLTQSLRVGLLNAGAVSMVLSSLSGVVRAQDTVPKKRSQVRVAAKISDGINTVTFKTPQGQIRVFLPAEIRPGDAILASAVLEPKGKQEAEQDNNRTQLAVYRLSLHDQGQGVQSPVLTWKLPVDDKADSVALILTDVAQEEAARVLLPLQAGASVNSRTSPDTGSTSDRIKLPAKGQAGRPLIFQQTFTGGTEDLHVWVGDKEARLLAASPRFYAVESPKEVLGKTKLQIKRGSELVAEGDFRNNRVRNSNPWGYIIGAVAIVGIALAVSAAKAVNDIQNGFNMHPPF